MLIASLMNDLLLLLIVFAFLANAALNRMFGDGWPQELGEHIRAWWWVLKTRNDDGKASPRERPKMEGWMMLPELMTVKEAAKALHVSAAIVYRWVETGVLACYRLGSSAGKRGAIRLAAADIAAFLETLKTQKGLPAVKPAAQKKNLVFKHLNAEKLLQAWKDA